MNAPRTRAQKKLIKVTFADGTVICYSNATTTFIEALKKIGVDKLKDIDLEIGHLPMISRECHEKFKDYMKPLEDGWYVNTQSDSSQKYIQLTSIRNTLGLDYIVEIGTDLEPCSSKGPGKSRMRRDTIFVTFPDGDCVCCQSAKDTYVETIKKLGLEKIRQKGIEVFGKECVTRFNKYPNQVEVESHAWVTIPGITKDKIKALNAIAEKLKVQLLVEAV